MNILIAPNSMKGSLNAFEFADIVEKAFYDYSNKFTIRKVSVADGGDFTGEILKQQLQARGISVEVRGPLGKTVQSKFAIAHKTAIIEMADASGMKLISGKELNPLKASSFGTGQLIKKAIKSGCTEIFLAIGGSATVDGGMGMMEALGVQFFNEKGEPLAGNGENLTKIKRIQFPEINQQVTIKIICDVDNPLLGTFGAAAVFGPQKGATPPMVSLLEKGLKNWSALIAGETGRELARLEGSGAAGGVAVPLVAFFNA
ncbi:MAG: glycerate kinase, partial [Prolixibacteraceae bacterium]|nr:glycerate kinase [Prolixibacteraceae bacterium]